MAFYGGCPDRQFRFAVPVFCIILTKKKTSIPRSDDYFCITPKLSSWFGDLWSSMCKLYNGELLGACYRITMWPLIIYP